MVLTQLGKAAALDNGNGTLQKGAALSAFLTKPDISATAASAPL